MILNKIFYGKKDIRLIWPIITIIAILLIGERFLIDPFGKLLQNAGFAEPQISNAQDWPTAIYSFLKRGMRILTIFLAVWLAVKFLLRKSFSFIGYTFREKWHLQLVFGIVLGFVI